ncbi:H+ nucleoside cotransporter [Pyrrhoderma noxium]|uniref:H+ nucleoside cotransporter n=1 Tax=Pyrrhoderma noxium TaxID=2282107 RepID=A0A286UHA5_9AGAM|nr:H+ nucleoside cotransporter [Pyrrhoderma noxium]
MATAMNELVSDPVQRRTSRHSGSDNSIAKERPVDKEAQILAKEVEKDEMEVEADRDRRRALYQKFRPFILGGLAALILGWWISATVLQATRHRWIVQTLFAWFFILVIAFRFIPASVVSRPISAIWYPCIQEPWYKLPYTIRLTIGWACLLGIVFGSAFGFPLLPNTNYGDRAINVLGLFVFQCGFYLSSSNRKVIPWPTVIVGLFLQQAIAMFVLKSGAGFSIFKWLATLASDFLKQGLEGAAFFFSDDFVSNSYFFVNTLSEIIFFIAFVQMMYYLGVMQWMIKNFAWFFFKIMNVSGAEAVVAASSPWIGQGESACLVRPYVDLMTESELHLTMTSGFSTIAGSVLSAYIALGVPAQNLVTASVMSIPASIAISKMRMPEDDEPVTRGSIVVDRGDADKNPPANALHAFSRGAWFGLMVAGSILTNVLTIVSLVAAINGLLTWIGKGFGIHALTLQLVLGYIFYPVTFFIGVPRGEILRVSQLLATKLIANEFVAYLNLQEIQATDNPLSDRAFTIASYALCGFANLGSLGIQIGVLSALAPSRARIIARIALSAMICGFLSTLQAAGIAGMLV